MTDFGIDATRELMFNSEPCISLCPGVWTAALMGTHIGYHGHDAFTVVQTYDWAHSGQTCKKWRLGFREKQQMSMKFQVLKKCPCTKQQGEVERRHAIDKLLVWPVAAKQESDDDAVNYIAKHPEDDWNASRNPKRIFYNAKLGSSTWLETTQLDGSDWTISSSLVWRRRIIDFLYEEGVLCSVGCST
ncbi:hypothetical protein PG996_010582 [Apiospora saccharicola]|uniref:Uncharacterized protein n=1 Tax=Apiospora saccharicola TaxID=335842 RepID=A0ABR1UPN3_9PEZI